MNSIEQFHTRNKIDPNGLSKVVIIQVFSVKFNEHHMVECRYKYRPTVVEKLQNVPATCMSQTCLVYDIISCVKHISRNHQDSTRLFHETKSFPWTVVL